jgi:hypothetical protein
MSNLAEFSVVFRLAVIATIFLTMRYPDEYRRAMARVCSVEEFPPYPRSAAIALIVFLTLTLFVDFFHALNR